MTWEQKLQALQALSDVALHMRKPGDWYVNASMEIGADDSGVLVGSYGNGTTPQEAVEDHWSIYTVLLKPKEYCVICTGSQATRRHVRWNGFMWQDVYSTKLETV
jgi:hypothetical protein